MPLLNAGTDPARSTTSSPSTARTLTPNQLIKIDGKIMAIAMMVNVQHLMYREDILNEPRDRAAEDLRRVLAAAEKIKAAGMVQYPVGGDHAHRLEPRHGVRQPVHGHGGQFFGADNKPSVNNEAGVKTLETMKALTAYMDPGVSYVRTPTYVQKQFQQGKIALSNFWASRAGAMDNDDESAVVGKVQMAAAPAALPGGKPATTVWWDGIVIAKNISDAEAEAAFRLAVEGIDQEMVKANNDDAVWLVKGYKTSRLAEGAIASCQGRRPALSRLDPAMGLMHTALGENVLRLLHRQDSTPSRRSPTSRRATRRRQRRRLLR